jgi:hypothetical protein
VGAAEGLDGMKAEIARGRDSTLRSYGVLKPLKRRRIVRKVTEGRPDEQPTEATALEGEPEFESTMDKLNRGALPPDDPLVQAHAAIERLRAMTLERRR